MAAAKFDGPMEYPVEGYVPVGGSHSFHKFTTSRNHFTLRSISSFTYFTLKKSTDMMTY